MLLANFKAAGKLRNLRVTVYVLAIACFSYLFWPTLEDVNHHVLGNTVYPAAKPGYKPVDLNGILMYASEVKLVHKYLRRGVKNYLEWGSGGSSFNFPQYVSGRVVSIEHDKEWCDKVKRGLNRTKNIYINSNRVEVRCVSVERGTGGWGVNSPFEEGSYPVFKEYIDEISKASTVTKGRSIEFTKWDFVLIDGRARVDAAIKSLSFIGNNSVVVLHDSWRTRWKYAEVFDYYNVVEESISFWSQGVVVMKRKPKFSYLEGRPFLVQKILDAKYNL